MAPSNDMKLCTKILDANLLTCQRLIFRWYREPATENVMSPQFTAPEVTRNHDGGNRKPLSLWQRQYGGANNNMAAK